MSKLLPIIAGILATMLLAIFIGEAAADGNPAALVGVAVIFGVPAGVVTGLVMHGMGRGAQAPTYTTQVTHQHQHLHVYDAHGQQVSETERSLTIR